MISNVVWNGAAYKAGLTINDKILAVNGLAMNDADTLVSAIKLAQTSKSPIELLVQDRPALPPPSSSTTTTACVIRTSIASQHPSPPRRHPRSHQMTQFPSPSLRGAAWRCQQSRARRSAWPWKARRQQARVLLEKRTKNFLRVWPRFRGAIGLLARGHGASDVL